MPVSRRHAPKDEYSLFEKLASKGVAVAPFATSVSAIGVVGIPATLVIRGGQSPQRMMIAAYGDVVPAIARATREAKSFFMQKHVTGHEVACGVIMDGRKIMPLVPVEVIPRLLHESGAWHLKSVTQDAVQALAKAAHTAVGAKRHSCVRMVVDDGMPYVTGVDVEPALARTSLFMRSAKLTGLTEEEIKEFAL